MCEMLPIVSVPYLPKISNRYEYTLVLDLDETLIHYIEYQPNPDS